MSDLSATNCGCDCERRDRSCGNNSCIWIILILLFCCGGNSWGRRGDDCCDNNCLWIIILLFFCGGCGCGGSGLFDGGCC